MINVQIGQKQLRREMKQMSETMKRKTRRAFWAGLVDYGKVVKSEAIRFTPEDAGWAIRNSWYLDTRKRNKGRKNYAHSSQYIGKIKKPWREVRTDHRRGHGSNPYQPIDRIKTQARTLYLVNRHPWIGVWFSGRRGYDIPRNKNRFRATSAPTLEVTSQSRRSGGQSLRLVARRHKRLKFYWRKGRKVITTNPGTIIHVPPIAGRDIIQMALTSTQGVFPILFSRHIKRELSRSTKELR